MLGFKFSILHYIMHGNPIDKLITKKVDMRTTCACK